jgi:hypothetical protein
VNSKTHSSRSFDLAVVAAFAVLPLSDVPAQPCGDLDGDGSATVSDAVTLLRYLFLGAPPPEICVRLDQAWFQWPIEEGGNGHWYRLTGPGTRSQVQDEALRVGGYLVVINHAEEQSWLNEQFPPTQRDPNLWIGLFQDLNDPDCTPACEPERGWKWVNGETSEYRGWARGEPNNDTAAVPSEDHAVMHCFGVGLWCDFHESTVLRGIVEAPGDCIEPTPVVPGFIHQGKNPEGLNEYEHEVTRVLFVLLSFEGALGRFLIAKYEVSQEEWRRVIDSHPEIVLEPPPPAPNVVGADLPMHQVSWNDCRAWVDAVGLELPTVNQWEAACSGQSDLYEVAWFDDNSGNMPHPVGTKKANQFGLHDMLGNMFEWCEDAAGAGARSVRGGGWDTVAASVSCSGAFSHSEATRASDVGFRPVFNLR